MSIEISKEDTEMKSVEFDLYREAVTDYNNSCNRIINAASKETLEIQDAVLRILREASQSVFEDQLVRNEELDRKIERLAKKIKAFPPQPVAVE